MTEDNDNVVTAETPVVETTGNSANPLPMEQVLDVLVNAHKRKKTLAPAAMLKAKRRAANKVAKRKRREQISKGKYRKAS